MLKLILSHWGFFSLVKLNPFILPIFIIHSQHFNPIYPKVFTT
jgi:hypothetical protein